MEDTRTFECRIQEATYSGTVTVEVDAEQIEWEGNAAIENAAWRQWRRKFGPAVGGLTYRSCEILQEVE